MNTYRRRGLAKVIAEKALLSESLKNLNKATWYSVDKSQLDNDVFSNFVQMHSDADTERFLDDSIEQSDRLLAQVWKSMVSSVLNVFMTKTSINGLLRRGSMFVFSTDQIRRLLNMTFFDSGSTLIDLGAGDGATTEKYLPLIRQVYTTEKSGPMIRILAEKGFRLKLINSLAWFCVRGNGWLEHVRMCGKDVLPKTRVVTHHPSASNDSQLLDVDTWWTREEKFDVVSCLNLLDRCSNPAKLLDEMKKALKPNGRIVVALVLPYKPYDEFSSAEPEQKLPITGITFEEQVCSAVHDVFEPSGLEVLCWTRLPYLCEGDLSQDYYWLHDAVFVMSAKTLPQVVENA